MTIPVSGPITLGQVAAELGIGLPLSLGDSRVRALAGVPSGPITLGQMRGKSGAQPLSATATGDSGFENSQFGAGSVSCSPRVTAGGGSGTITYLWEFTSNPDSCALTSSTSAACSVAHSYIKNTTGSATATLRCTVQDGAGAVIVLNNISASLEWAGTL
jgi:hypothetical protein